MPDQLIIMMHFKFRLLSGLISVLMVSLPHKCDAQMYLTFGGHFPYLRTNASALENAPNLEDAYKDHAAIALSLGYKLPGTKFDFELAYARYQAHVYLNLMNHPKLQLASSDQILLVRSFGLSGNYLFLSKSRIRYFRTASVGIRTNFAFIRKDPAFWLKSTTTEEDGLIFQENFVELKSTNEGLHLLFGPQIQFQVFKVKKFSVLLQGGYQWGLDSWAEVKKGYWAITLFVTGN